MVCRREGDGEGICGGLQGMKVELGQYVNRHEDKLKRLAWSFCWAVFARLTPRWLLAGWRATLVRLFGGRIARGVRINGRARIWSPNRLTIGANSWIAEDANLYCVAPIEIGANAVVSEGAFVCTAEHDVTSPKFELKTAAITIGDMAWVGAGAMILPGRHVGEGAVVAARSVVTHDVAPWTVVAGNPAREIRKRRIQPPASDITFVIPVRNEEVNLPGCLECLRPYPHVVVVDSHSTDGTKAVFERERQDGWEFVEFTWNGRYPKKRNWLLENYRFKTQWVMFLDADERVTEEWIAELSEVVKLAESRTVDAYVCYYDNLFMGRMLRHGDVMHKTAILRVGRGAYERVEEESWSKLDMEIHEQLVVEGETGVIRARLRHFDRRPLENYLEKHEEYAKWEANRYRALTPERWQQLTRRQRLKYSYVRKWWFAPGYFLVSYVFRFGFLDGLAGFWFAWYKMRYFMNVRRKIAENR